MFSGFAIIIATTIALGSMAQDQSGHAAAVVSRTFRTELGSRDADAQVIAIDDDMLRNLPPARRQLSSLMNKPFAQVKINVDPQQDFPNLQSELQRIVGEIQFDRPMHEICINLPPGKITADSSLIDQICELLAAAESELARGSIKIEIQTWATSPTPEAWVDATQVANRLREKVLAKQSLASQSRCQISTSAGLWPHTNELRPASTVVLRLPVIY